jgi:CheY-like chemotaxis protein
MTTTTDMELEIDFDETVLPPEPASAPRPRTSALVVEDDPEVARLCVQRLARLEIQAKVVWCRDEALAILARQDLPLAFAFVDTALHDGSGPQIAARAAELRPAMPIVLSSGAIQDVLTADGVVLCKPFTPEQFEAAFDAALLDERTWRILDEAAETVRREMAAEPVLA